MGVTGGIMAGLFDPPATKYGPGFCIVPTALITDPLALRVWMALWSKASFRERVVEITHAEIIEQSELSSNSVRKGVETLRSRGYIEYAPVFDGAGGCKGNRYNLYPDPMARHPSHEMQGEPLPSDEPPTSMSQRTTTEVVAWAVKLANNIRKHVEDTHNLKTSDKDRDRWARALDRLTRSTSLAKKPDAAEVERVITWGLNDRAERGSWPGWYMNIRSAPNAKKFANIQAAMHRDVGEHGLDNDEDLM